jgi:hypothetical protein
MTDQTSAGGLAPHRTPRAEFRIYWTLIFLGALPFESLAWGLRALARGALPDRGPLARALSLANEITPMIFWP